jgi:hypothetical protein
VILKDWLMNFSKVLKEYHKKKPTIILNPWFYGGVGLSSLIFFFFVNNFSE